MPNSHDEIFLQYEALRRTYDEVLLLSEAISSFFQPALYEDVVFLACGSSYWASLSAHMTFEHMTGWRSFAVKAGDVVLNPEHYSKIYRKPLLVVPSRSGATTEVLRAIEILRRSYGSLKILCFVEYEDSPLEQVADVSVRLPFANETSVCQTRSFACLYLGMTLLAAVVSKNRSFLHDVHRYLEEAPTLFRNMETRIQGIVDVFPACSSLVVLGSGMQYGVAVEAAYIAIEMAAFSSNYYMTLELRHGPIVRLDGSTLVAQISSREARPFEMSMAAEAKARGVRFLAVVDDGEFPQADWVFSLGNEFSPEVVALHGVAVMQGFAYFKAIQLGIDPDRPAGLVPFIRF